MSIRPPGRVGRFLLLASKVFDAAESDRLGSIDDTFTRALQAPGHVGIVISDTEMIEAYAAGFPVRVSTYGIPSAPPGDQVVASFTRPATAGAR